MAYDMDTLLRRLKVNTAAPSGVGATGLNYGGEPAAGGGLNTNYTPQTFGSNPSGGSGNIQGYPMNGGPGYTNLDDAAFDKTYQTNWDSLQRRLADAGSQYDLSNQTDEEDYQRALRETGQQQELDSAALVDRMANQGMLRSGIQVKAQGDLADSYAKRLDEFNRQRTSAKTQRETNYTGIKRDIQDQLAALQNERAAREAARQEAIAKQIAEQQANAQEALQRGQPQQTPTGYLVPGMGFQNTPRTVIGGSGQLGSDTGIPESPLNVINNPMGFKQGLMGTSPSGNLGGATPEFLSSFQQQSPEIKAILMALGKL